VKPRREQRREINAYLATCTTDSGAKVSVSSLLRRLPRESCTSQARVHLAQHPDSHSGQQQMSGESIRTQHVYKSTVLWYTFPASSNRKSPCTWGNRSMKDFSLERKRAICFFSLLTENTNGSKQDNSKKPVRQELSQGSKWNRGRETSTLSKLPAVVSWHLSNDQRTSTAWPRSFICCSISRSFART